MHAGLASTINLGMSDVYPAGSGKQGAAIQIARHFGADLCDCAFLCDDDNDIQLAKVVGKAYLPSVAAVRYFSFDACPKLCVHPAADGLCSCVFNDVDQAELCIPFGCNHCALGMKPGCVFGQAAELSGRALTAIAVVICDDSKSDSQTPCKAVSSPEACCPCCPDKYVRSLILRALDLAE